MERVLVKPNVCGMYPSSLSLLEAVLYYFMPYIASMIIGELPYAMRMPKARFHSLGIMKLVQKKIFRYEI